MNAPDIKTAVPVVPMIYAYITPGVTYHEGWSKIGYTERDVKKRIYEQTHTAGIRWALEWQGNAKYEDGSGETFRDTDFHVYLRGRGVEQEDGGDNEWFKIVKPESKQAFDDFRKSHGILDSDEAVVPYRLRDEQERAVTAAKEYCEAHKGGEFLWNCKPRFGKTLATYELAKRINARTVLIVTNRPAIANSWLQDYCRFLGPESGYRFVSDTDALQGKPGALTQEQFLALPSEKAKKCIEFVSLQDLKGSLYFGGKYDKLKEIIGPEWSMLVVDEAHEGVDTYKTDIAFDKIRRKFTLHLSGTPFKALAGGKFAPGAIFNWTYADEQKMKAEWHDPKGQENPYADLPRMSLYTYKLSEIVKDKLRRGIEIDGADEMFAFDLNEFFATDGNGRFRYEAEVDNFLDALTRQKRFPFSTPELRNELKHTFWLLERVDSAKALVRKLNGHPVFKDYEVVLAAGDGKTDADDMAQTQKSYDKVVRAIASHDKTITVSVGQLTTGVTVPEWTGVLMLCGVKSPALYMQAAFRAQNPCLFRDGENTSRKTDAYVFDFDPARTLIIFEQFANDLYSDTAAGRGDSAARKRNIGELLNFFPVIGEDDKGELVELDAEKVLSIPRRIKSEEVVRRGFMSNFLFQNISQIFGAPKEVMDIIGKFDAVKENKALPQNLDDTRQRLSLDENGEVAVADDEINGKVSELFGDKIYSVEEIVDDLFLEAKEEDLFDDGSTPSQVADQLKKKVTDNVIADIVGKAKEKYGDAMKPSDARRIESGLKAAAERKIDTVVANNEIERKIVEQERKDALQARHESGRSEEEINREYDNRQLELSETHKKRIEETIADVVATSERETVRQVETKTRERERDGTMEMVRDRLRGFSRTIPSFLMAYGDASTTLATFDAIVPDEVFKEVTGITLDQFRFLRDGGTYKDSETGEENTFQGNLFDPVVFDDSVKEFLAKRSALANYFDDSADEDIFDYIPPQKTNQIFTPRKVVVRMVDLLEQENPGCFGKPEKTFVDLYMKSGMYITEIVKRLFRNKRMKTLFPNDDDRLRHIFEKQVFGLAPTEIIYRIATNYILGFAAGGAEIRHNFKKLDALACAKDGTLQAELDKLYE